VIRKVLAVLGVGLAALGLVLVFDRGLAARLSVTETVLIPIAALALIQGYRVLRGRMGTSVQIAETGDLETEQDLGVPGDDFDERLARLRGNATFGVAGAGTTTTRRDHVIRNRERIRNRLEEAAVATVSNKWGCSTDRAREAIEEGAWTDDPYAAAFFTGEVEDLALRERVRNVLSPESRYQIRAKRGAAAIAELSEADAERVRQEVPSR